MIFSGRRHPEFFKLSRYVERGEDSADWGQVRSHLRDCTKCRDEVAWIKRLHDESRRLGDVQPPSGILDRILERRTDGERMILPAYLPPERPARRRAVRWAGASAVVAILAIVPMIMLTSRATAGSNSLSFEPRFPQPGDTIKIRYVPTIGLAGADSLRLRIRFRADAQNVDDEDYPGDYLSLQIVPDDTGEFTATFKLPPGAAYGQMAVEDTRGRTVDTDNHRLWELLTYDGNGQVRFEALRQRAYMAEWSQDWRRREETSNQLTQLFPDQPEGWTLRFRYELTITDPTNRDSVLAVHRAALHRLGLALESREPSAVDLAMMMRYSADLGEDSEAEKWENRLASLDPGFDLLQRRRLMNEYTKEPDPVTMLNVLEKGWLESNPKDYNMAQIGLSRALAYEQWDRAGIWARRLISLDTDNAFSVGCQLATHAPTRKLGVDYLRQADRLSEFDLEEDRPIGDDVLTYQRDRSNRQQRILTELANALIKQGETTKAMAVIERAADLGWDPLLLRQLAEYRLTAGDTLAALDLLARAATDPLTGSESELFGRTIAAAYGTDEPIWRQYVAAERERFRRWMMEATEYQHLSPDVTAETREGNRVALSSVLRSEPTLLVVTSYLNGRAPDSRYETLLEISNLVAARMLPLVVLATWVERSEYQAFLDANEPDFPVFHDPDNIAGEVFGVIYMTEYLVFDAQGIVRGKYSDLDKALRLLFLLPRQPQVA